MAMLGELWGLILILVAFVGVFMGVKDDVTDKITNTGLKRFKQLVRVTPH